MVLSFPLLLSIGPLSRALQMWHLGVRTSSRHFLLKRVIRPTSTCALAPPLSLAPPSFHGEVQQISLRFFKHYRCFLKSLQLLSRRPSRRDCLTVSGPIPCHVFAASCCTTGFFNRSAKSLSVLSRNEFVDRTVLRRLQRSGQIRTRQVERGGRGPLLLQICSRDRSSMLRPPLCL
jgi:hypothetical protein